MLVLGVGGAMSILTWLLTRKKAVHVDRAALQENDRQYYETKVKVEQERNEEFKALNEELNKKIAEHKAWLESRKEELKDEFKKDYKRLSTDSKLLIERLDAVLGTKPGPE